MHYKHTQKDLSTIKIKKMQENEKESVFPLFTENLEMKMWTLAVRQEQQVEKVFEKNAKIFYNKTSSPISSRKLFISSSVIFSSSP